MKKAFALVAATFLLLSVHAKPTAKVLKAFAQTYAAAENVQWQEQPDFYTATFQYSGISTRVSYDSNGNILHTIRYYDPALLPSNVFTRLKKEYASGKLFGVTEITEGEYLFFFVKVETEKSWITLKVDPSGNSEVVEKYRKA